MEDSDMGKSLFLLASLLAIACTVENADTPEEAAGLVQMTFTGSREGLTKTSLDSSYGITWSSSDAVSLFSTTGSTGAEFKVSSTEASGSIATFTGLTSATSNGYYYALSPADATARLVSSSGTVMTSIPSSQTGVENSFDPAANISLARVNEGAENSDILHFRNAGALLSFLVPGNYVTRVKIESRDGSVAMTGPANIDYNDGEPKVSATTASKNYVEVTVPSGSIGKRFYACVYPGNYSQGFIVTFYTDQLYNRYYSTKALDLKRNAIIRLVEKNWAENNDRPQNESGTELIAPTISSGGQQSATSAKISFTCVSGKRDAYKLYVRDASSMGNGTLVHTLSTGSGQYGTYSYNYTGLSTGASYDLWVSAACESSSEYADSPITWLEDVTINAAVSNMSVKVESSAATYYGFVVNYTISGLSSTGSEHGIIFSYTSPTPTCGSVGAEGKLPGPVI